MGMLFVEIGREVAMRKLQHRDNKAVVTGIIDNKFIVIVKQDKTNEVIRVDDIVLCDKVHNVDSLEKDGFFNVAEKRITSDFDRYKMNLRTKIADELYRSN